MRSAVRPIPIVLAVLPLVVATVLLLPRPSSAALDLVSVAAAARQAQPGLGFTPAVPAPLPPGWVATDAELRSGPAGIPTWHVGYLTGQGRRASVEQAVGATWEWENVLNSGGVPVGTVTVGDRTWEQAYTSDRDVTALVHRGSPVVTLVTSRSGGLPDARALALALTTGAR